VHYRLLAAAQANRWAAFARGALGLESHSSLGFPDDLAFGGLRC
jgi:hypothetical protein